MAQPLQTAPDVLGETLGSLLGELAWNQTEQPASRVVTRSAPSWRPATAVAAAAPAEALGAPAMASGPWSMALDALAGRLVVRAPTIDRATVAEAALASRVEARPTNPATAPWSYVLQRLAAKDPRPAAAASGASETTAAGRWKTVATRSPGETVGELLGSVDWA